MGRVKYQRENQSRVNRLVWLMDLTKDVPPDKRTKTIHELYNSELIYLKNLSDMIDGYITPLREKEILPQKTIQGIFSNVDTILKAHEGLFMSSLREKVKSWTDESKVGDIFLAIAPGFKFYTQYCSNYDTSIGLVQSCKKDNSQFSQFLKEAQAKYNGTYITSYLILPIQRIPRYEMFLKELVKLTDSSHPDYNDLQIALKSVTEMAETVNEVCIKVENMQKIIEVAKVTGLHDLLAPTRKLVRQDDLEIKWDGVPGTSKCFLFNDLLVISFNKRGRVSNYRIPIPLIWLTPDLDNSTQISFVTLDGTVTLQFSTTLLKSEWETDFQESLQFVESDAYEDRATHAKQRKTYKLTKQGNAYHLEGGPVRKKKKKGILDSWKREFRKKKRSKTEIGGTPPHHDPETGGRRRSFDGSDPVTEVRSSSALQNPSHSDTTVINRREFRRSVSVANHSRNKISKSSSSMNLTAIQKN